MITNVTSKLIKRGVIMKNFLVIDFEYTQYRKKVGRPRGFFSEIIEFGALKLDHTTLNETAKVETFVKPHFYPKQAAEMMEFCSITEADMKKAMPFNKMIDKINDLYVPDETWFVAWGESDYKVLDTGCQRHKVENPVKQSDYLDLANVYKHYKGYPNTPGLNNSAKELGIEVDGHWHAAFDDAALTAKILTHLLEKDDFNL